MSDEAAAVAPQRGQPLRGTDGRRIGTIDAVFADYLLVRTTGLLPVDLYVPRAELAASDETGATVDRTADEAYAAWHRPLRRADHGDH